MVWACTTEKPGATFGTEGKFFWTRPTDTLPVAATEFIDTRFPSGVHAIANRPSFAPLNGDGISRLYMAGAWDDNLAFTEHYRLVRQGIIAPLQNIVNAAGGGLSVGVQLVAPTGSGVTGEAIPYLSWWDDLHARRSPLSAAGPTISATADAFKWDNLPTSHPSDITPTHLEGWRAMNGQSPRLAWRRQLGVLEVTEEIATLALGEAFPDVVEKFPRCRYNVMWHDRQVLAGDDRYPDRVYFSLLNQPEMYGGLYIRTRRGERVTALAVVRDNLIVFTPFSCYIVTGYTEDDLSMRILEPGIGCISHHGISLIHGYAFVPTHLGIYLFTGSTFHFLSRDFQTSWRSSYFFNQDKFEDSFAANDIAENVYRLHAPGGGTGSDWILDYDPVLQEVGGEFGAPDLSWDQQFSSETQSYGSLSVPSGRRVDLYSGGADGIIRQENYINLDTGATDDDGNLYSSTWEVPFFYPGGSPGGNRNDGWKFETLWVHMLSENTDWFMTCRFGESGATIAWPSVTDFPNGLPVERSAKVIETEVEDEVCESHIQLRTSQPQAIHFFEPNQSGRGMTITFRTDNAGDGVSWFTAWSGWGCTFSPGTADRKEVVSCQT